jgi:hypothetical protein
MAVYTFTTATDSGAVPSGQAAITAERVARLAQALQAVANSQGTGSRPIDGTPDPRGRHGLEGRDRSARAGV